MFARTDPLYDLLFDAWWRFRLQAEQIGARDEDDIEWITGGVLLFDLLRGLVRLSDEGGARVEVTRRLVREALDEIMMRVNGVDSLSEADPVSAELEFLAAFNDHLGSFYDERVNITSEGLTVSHRTVVDGLTAMAAYVDEDFEDPDAPEPR
jgi:hypothetical protein